MKALPLAALLGGFAVTALAQGPLTPPGAPSPTMKALDQVEPRTLVNATNTPGDANNTFIISQPGSYYLVGNVSGAAGKNGISIQASNVSLDLNGFSLVGGTGTTRGIDVPSAQLNLRLRNGTVRNWNFGGVRAFSSLVVAEGLSLIDNLGAAGLEVGNGSLVKDCVARGNGLGFRAADRSHFANCIATVSTSNGFEVANYVTLLDCTSSRNGGDGFNVGGTCALQRCSATRNDGTGINFSDGSTLSDCTAGANVAVGIAGARGTLSRCTAHANGVTGTNFSSGISVSGCSIANCTATANAGDGITANFSSVTSCSASGNGYIGIDAFNGVLAFSRAAGNNQAGTGAPELVTTGTTRTGNYPAP